MLKHIAFTLLIITTYNIQATELNNLSPKELKNKIAEINIAQNQVLMQGSTVADADKLFALYTDDFVYIHEVYGGTYSRDELYKNTIKFLKAGRYTNTKARYKIVSTISGYNGIAVERQEIYQGVTANHLAVFEFRGDKVSKIIEY
jgi:hypothetical protein